MTSSLSSMEQLLSIMQALRDPEKGCPWDIKQDFSTIAPTLSRSHEVNEAIATGDMDKICDELAIYCCKLFFTPKSPQSRTATFADVAQGISDKMIRRHPMFFRWHCQD